MSEHRPPGQTVTALQAVIFQAARAAPPPEAGPAPADSPAPGAAQGRDTLRASLKIEAIGDHWVQCYHVTGRLPASVPPLIRAHVMSGRGTPWVARITGRDRRGLRREFMEGVRDFAHANGSGSRGIWVYYALPGGVYEVNEPIAWRRNDRYFVRVRAGALERISREEAEREIDRFSAGG